MSSGVGFLPLACSAACPGFLARGRGSEVAVAAVGVRTGPGWSGRCGGRAAGGVEEVQPFVLAVPAFGQVQGDVAAAVPGDAGGDVDQVAADGGAAGLGEGEAGQGSGGAQQVVRHGRDRQPGGVRGEEPGGQVSQGAVVPSAKTCSTTAWSRCCSSAWISSNGESVKTAW